MKQKISIISLLFIIFNISIYAQTGKVNYSRNWHKISTEHFNILFNPIWKPEADRVARNLEELYKKDNLLGNRRLGKTTILLQGNTLQSNGFVGFAPFRSEFFLMPPQNSFLSSGKWIDLLSIHEYHHVLQYHKTNKGIVKGFKFLFGEYGQAISSNILIPKWFWEGDAVYAESKYSNGGRGISADFLKYYRAIALDTKGPSLKTSIGGTINKFTPNHYALGYLLTKQIRDSKNEFIFDNILDRTVLNFNSFTSSIKQKTGKGLKEHYSDAINELRKEELGKDYWNTPSILKGKKRDFYTDHLSIYSHKDEIFYIKKDFKHIPRLQKLKDQSTIAKPGISLDNFHQFGINDEYICWSEYQKHPRWSLEDYSVVKLKNRKNRKAITLQKNSKHFHPQLHPNKNVLAVLSADNSNKFSLELWNIDSLILIDIIPLNYEHAREMYFNEDGSLISMIVSNGQSQGILNIDLKDKTKKLIIPLQNSPLNSPKIFGDNLYFLGTQSTDQYLFSYNLSTHQLYQTKKKFLHSQSFAFDSNRNLYFNDYSTGGYTVKRLTKDSLQSNFLLTTPIKGIQNPPIFQTPVVENKSKLINSAIPKYKLHSYSPSFTANGNGFKHLGITAFINDYLSISEIQFSYQKDMQGDDDKYLLDFNYGYLPIQIGFRARHDNANVSHHQIGTTQQTTGVYSIKEKALSIYLSYPHQQINGLTTKSFIPTIGRSTKSIELGILSDEVKSYFYEQELVLSRRKAIAQALPNLRFSHTLRLERGKSARKTVKLFETSNELVLPGLFATHSIKIKQAFRKHTTDSYQFAWDLIMPTGYIYSHEYIGQAIQKEKMHFYGFHYQLPLVYPNFGIGKFAYFKRIRLEGFYQNANFQGENETKYTQFTSKGIHVFLDANWFQMGNASLIFTYSKTPESINSDNYFGIGLEVQLQ